ncbi:MAG: hypothetical protein BGO34_06680 [Bacteroidia bacterium 44-10]|nr:MAG: hypothetical protein BGO34_06680 [Bacteroidia bacterium 44-10]
MSKDKKGYKETEFGVIPIDWTIDTFGNLLEGFTSGATPLRAIPSFYNGDILWISSGELNYNWITDTLEHISPEAQKRTNLKQHPVGTFLMAITGLEAEGTRGRCAFVGKPATTNQSCLAIYPTEKLTTEYLFYFYRQYANYLAFKYCQGTKQQSYTAKIVKQLPICCPTDINEQRAIAEALSDIDTLINTLNKQIEKKKNIKQGMMQELLTGKKRLRGFTAKWEEKTLGEIGRWGKGNQLSKKLLLPDGIYYCIHYGELFTTYKEVAFVCYSKCNLNNNVILSRKGDILFPASDVTPTGLGRCSAIMVDNVVLGGDIIYFRPNEEYHSIFLSYSINYNKKSIIELVTGTTVKHINSTQLKTISIHIPTKEEQSAITKILTDIDKEIEQLEKKRNKYHNIKSGMMQQLLTGQIRLTNIASLSMPKEIKIENYSSNTKKHSKQFDEAVIISFLVDKFGSSEKPLSRFMYTKLSYLIHRKHDSKVVDFEKFAAGPYNPKSRYGGPENIGKENEYFKLVKDAKGYDAFAPMENIQEAVNYFTQWYGSDIPNWIDLFRNYKPWDLETLATVDMAICDLEEKKIPINVGNIKNYLASIPKWKAKLNKTHFSDRHIQNAINECIRLFKI